ncbi:MAG TPA: hypothetical protein VNT32_11735 [Thermoleophilaceae bacterium]|nr:hypothetical protein [Thermoleophilaceae bacterium]
MRRLERELKRLDDHELTARRDAALERKTQLLEESRELDAQLARADLEIGVFERILVMRVIEAAEVLAEAGPVAWLDDQADPTGRQRRILAVLVGAHRPLRPAQIQAALTAAGDAVDAHPLQLLLGRMLRRGYLERAGRGLYRPARSMPAAASGGEG